MKKAAFVFMTFVLFQLLGRAQLVLSNWEISQDSLSFDISGTFTSAQAPGSNLGLLWLADIGNGAWINDDTNPSPVITGTIDGYDVSTNFPTIFSFKGGSGTNVGAYLDFGGFFGDGIEFDFTDGSSNEVNIHLEMTSAGKYNPASISPGNLELYWGGDAFAATPGIAMNLTTATVPEPSAYALLGGGMGLMAALVFRGRRRLTSVKA